MSLIEVIIIQVLVLTVSIGAYTMIQSPAKELSTTCNKYQVNLLPTELKPDNKEFISDTTSFIRDSKEQSCSFVVKNMKTAETEITFVKESTAIAKVKAFDLAENEKENASENSQDHGNLLLGILALFTIVFLIFIFSPIIIDKIDDIKYDINRKKREKLEKEAKDKLLFEQLKKKNVKIKKQEKIASAKKIYI